MNRNLKLPLCLLLIVMSLAVFWNVQGYGFTVFDDGVYVTENETVRKGLTWDGLVWAFTTSGDMYWHPITWLSHMVDCHLYGLNAKGHHFNNLLFHTANGVLLFLILCRMTGTTVRSFLVAAFFLLHPLGVESVAWVSERKNLLSTFFWMLTLWSYVRYVERPGVTRYLLMFFPFLLGLMSKPILVTLPFLFLLMDFWPLGRIRLTSGDWRLWNRLQDARLKRSFPGLVLEKVPFLLLSIVSVWGFSLSSHHVGHWISTRVVPLSLRVQNALVSYPLYIKKMVWPFDLAPFYPYPSSLPLWETGGAILFLLVITALVTRKALKHPCLLAGWFWFLGTLVPVLGLVQQGLWPRCADRFVYIPAIGLFVMAVWGGASLAKSWARERAFVVFSGVLLLVLGTIAWRQNQHWQDSITLFEHTLTVTTRNSSAHMNLGSALATAGREEEAIVQFEKALETGNPRPAKVHFNMGKALASLGKHDEALLHFNLSKALDPRQTDLYIDLGSLFISLKQWDKAQGEFSRALELDPKNKKALNNMGVVMLHRGEVENAVAWFRAALEVAPDYLMAKKNLEIASAKREVKGD